MSAIGDVVGSVFGGLTGRRQAAPVAPIQSDPIAPPPSRSSAEISTAAATSRARVQARAALGRQGRRTGAGVSDNRTGLVSVLGGTA